MAVATLIKEQPYEHQQQTALWWDCRCRLAWHGPLCVIIRQRRSGKLDRYQPSLGPSCTQCSSHGTERSGPFGTWTGAPTVIRSAPTSTGAIC